MSKITSVLAIIILSIGGILLAAYFSQVNQAPQSSNALIGGTLESGYEPAGFLIGVKDGKFNNLCGGVMINSNTVITAAHCLEENDSSMFGIGEFSLNNNIESSDFELDPLWKDKKNSNNDLAVIKFQARKEISKYAKVTSPQVNCNYRLVAYGRTESNSDENFKKERRGGDVCIKEILKDTFLIESPNSGVCLGDSGSPVFEKSSENLVGIISSINRVRDQDPCYVGNTAIVKRLDSNLNLISKYNSDVYSLPEQQNSSQDQGIIPAINATLLLSQDQNPSNYLLLLVLTVLIIVIIAFVIHLLRSSKTAKEDTPFDA